ncbi:hypothetical protein WJX81_008647 [Elliptochloris bilobata]|uniref:Histidinol-phosphatase n=1 Tax=Elliptochloris bilobata TaxID=381761 RepID=A0AAW1QY57_9CHLO
MTGTTRPGAPYTAGPRTAHRQGARPTCTPPGTALLPGIAGDVPEAFVELAHRLADAAAGVTRRYFRAPLAIEAKADESPVTIADREAEAVMRALVRQALPSHAVFGEESGMTPGDGIGGGEYLWIFDPIDGTKSFITGKPVFGTLVALLRRGEPVLGIIDQPIMRERWLGVRGRPTTLNGEEVHTRACASLEAAYLYATTPHMFAGASAAAFARVRDQVRCPLYGCDCYAYGLLAAGHCDLVVEADMKPYDYLALVPVVNGAGGRITDWQGGLLRWPQTPAGEPVLASTLPREVLAAGDARVHALALRALAWSGGHEGLS